MKLSKKQNTEKPNGVIRLNIRGNSTDNTKKKIKRYLSKKGDTKDCGKRSSNTVKTERSNNIKENYTKSSWRMHMDK